MLSHIQKSALLAGILDRALVRGSTHAFYRYPGRFSPAFARAAISAFTIPGDLVLDPFVGGGTTLVEATLAGRRSIGSDVSSLSVFLSRVKTTPLTQDDRQTLRRWFAHEVPLASAYLNSRALPTKTDDPATDGTAWAKRNVLQNLATAAGTLPTRRTREFALAVLLNSGQWALDNRRHLPSAAQLRTRILHTAGSMLAMAAEYSDVLAALPKLEKRLRRPTILKCPAAKLPDRKCLTLLPAPRLVLTSPPYPGVHVLYHRWQVQGRRESRAPFWITRSPDGNAGSFYTLAPREAHAQYLAQLEACFRALIPIVNDDTVFVQLVGFSDPGSQLPQFLSALVQAGLQEFRLPSISNSHDGRIWRSVPNRKWYNRTGQASQASEVVLFHRPK